MGSFCELLMPVVQFSGPSSKPQHIAIVMDGNRRWAHRRAMPAALGHAAGARGVRAIVHACADLGIPYLTLFAFSTENWQRPTAEVSSLMVLFVQYLEKETDDMNANGVRLIVIGDTQRFASRLQKLLQEAQSKTAANTRITLTVAVNYGGRWDVLQAMHAWQAEHASGAAAPVTEDDLRPHLSMAYAPDPDLVIRTGGESRISNFLLWQTAYSELYFSDTLWPDFTPGQLNDVIAWYGQRDRRYGGASQSATV